MSESERSDFNLSISRYISTAEAKEEIVLVETNKTLVDIEKEVQAALQKHNAFLMELRLPLLPR